MKRILSLLAAMFVLFSVQAQDSNKILGTWKIKSFQYGDHPSNNEWHTAFKKYKSYTPTHFIVTEISLKTNETTTSIFGTYEIKDGVYTERILHVNHESAFMIGQTFSFKISFDGNDKMYSTGAFNGMKSSELWERVTRNDGEAENQQKPSAGQVNINSGIAPLYVIKNGGKYLKLKFSGGKSPLSTISNDAIAEVEVLKNTSATDVFKEDGKNGVIILTLKEQDLQKTLKMLEAAGIATEMVVN